MLVVRMILFVGLPNTIQVEFLPQKIKDLLLLFIKKVLKQRKRQETTKDF
jgi:hypothetical protein